MTDSRLRDRLTALAEEIPPQLMVPHGLVHRARLRSALVVGATVACVVIASIGVAAGVRQVLNADAPVPGLPSPTPPPVATEDLITVVPIPYEGTAPSGAVVVDPAGGPNEADTLGLAQTSIPLDWSADGRRLLISSPGGDLSVRGADGAVDVLDVATGGFWGASWSPDGSRIVFGRGSGARTSLHLVDADGTNERVLLDAAPNERFLYPSWSPDGRTIAFLRTTRFTPVMERTDCDAACRHANDRGTTVWLVGADGSGAREAIADVTARASTYNAPAWSSDGLLLLFSGYTGSAGEAQVFVGDATGGSIRITSGPGAAFAPTWSPDGTLIAFLREVGDDLELRVAGHVGENERPVSSLAVPAVSTMSTVLWDRLPAI